MRMNTILRLAGLFCATVLLLQNATAAVQTYEGFDTNWPAQPPPSWGGYSNNIANPVSGWTINRGKLFATAAYNTAPAYCSLEQGSLNGDTGWILSPAITNGAGSLMFYYRLGFASPTNFIAIELSFDSGASWATNAVVTNKSTTMTGYTNTFSGPLSYSNQLVRIRPIGNINNLTFVDSIAVTYPLPSITAAPPRTIPNQPYENGNVVVSDDITAQGIYDSLNATNFWSIGGAAGSFTNAIAMIPGASNSYTTVSLIPGKPTGTTISYFVKVSYRVDGLPYTVISATNSYVVGMDYRYETFDNTGNWPGAPWTSGFSNTVGQLNGWSVTLAQIRSRPQTNSYPYLCLLQASSACSNTACITSPVLTNGIFSLSFYLSSTATSTNYVAIENSYDGGATWVTNAVITTTNTTARGITNAFPLTAASTYSNQIVRIRPFNSTASTQIDSILATYPPAWVSISNVFLSPGYPAARSNVTITCEVTSRNPNADAVGISPRLIYWTTNSSAIQTSSVAMTRTAISGKTSSFAAIIALTNVTRDTYVNYYIRTDFSGYYGLASENRSPCFYPGASSNTVTSFLVRAFGSSYSNVTAVISGTNNFARLLTSGLWQTVINIDTSDVFSCSFQGQGYSTGSGYSTSSVAWGNSNNWQATPPLSDSAGIGETNIFFAATNGQYVIRFDESTGLYLVNRCFFQDFDKPGEGDGTLYKSTLISSTARGSQQTFEFWPLTTVRSRSVDFTTWTPSGWTNGVSLLNDFLTWSGWLIYSSKVVDATYGLQTFTNTPPDPNNKNYSFIVQPSHWWEDPLRGIGWVSYTYRAVSLSQTNDPPALWVMLADAIDFPQPDYTQSDAYTNFQTDAATTWRGKSPAVITANITNQVFATTNVCVATNASLDFILTQTSDGVSNRSVYIKSATVGEWYSEPVTTLPDGWEGAGYFIESSAVPGVGNCCRLDRTRTATPTNQYIRTPKITAGIKYIEFYYAGARYDGNTGSTVPVTLNLELSYDLTVWTSLASISTNYNTGVATNFYYYKYNLNSSTPSMYVRIRNTTPYPGVLLLDRINIPGYATTNDWCINNGAPDYDEQVYPPLPRQFYRGACYLNNSTTANIDSGTNAPDPTRPAFIRSPYLPQGLGEISFWYRNWVTNGPVNPNTYFVIQTATNDSAESDWSPGNIITNFSNVVNTNDYNYFQASVYSPSTRYVRLYSFQPSDTPAGGRTCIDDLLVTYPLAAGVSMSNLVITPTIPLFSNTVDVAVDVYHLFLNPSNINLTAYYATASAYTGLTGAATTPLSMTCIASNMNVPGGWLRFKTSSPIPTQDSDMFVKYFVQAGFSGYHSEVASPTTCQSFGLYPSWYAPVDTLYGTNFAYYTVYACPTGSVWLNEINYIDWKVDWYEQWTNEYVELCGPEGASIQNWTLELFDINANPTAVYTLTNNTVLPASAGGHGFWVLGDAGVAGTSMTLTYSNGLDFADYGQNLPYGGYMVLKRSNGAYEDKISYGGAPFVAGFTDAGGDYSGEAALGLTGTGTNRADFAWPADMIAFSCGTINPGQTFTWPVEILTQPYILSFWVNSNVWINCSTTNSSWNPTPWYTTNIMASNSWTNVSVFSSSISPTNCILNFSKPAGTSPYFYRVVVTN